MNKKRIIKKYANRRLYDTGASKHVTMEGVRQLVVAGEDIHVIDDTDGTDVTRTVLLQIIAEQEQHGRPLLDTTMLNGIIRSYGNPMQELMSTYLRNSMDSFLSQQHLIQQQIQALLQPISAVSTVQEMAGTNLNAWQNMPSAVVGGNTATSDGIDTKEHKQTQKRGRKSSE